jgi:hypothetical protein
MALLKVNRGLLKGVGDLRADVVGSISGGLGGDFVYGNGCALADANSLAGICLKAPSTKKRLFVRFKSLSNATRAALQLREYYSSSYSNYTFPLTTFIEALNVARNSDKKLDIQMLWEDGSASWSPPANSLILTYGSLLGTDLGWLELRPNALYLIQDVSLLGSGYATIVASFIEEDASDLEQQVWSSHALESEWTSGAKFSFSGGYWKTSGSNPEVCRMYSAGSWKTGYRPTEVEVTLAKNSPSDGDHQFNLYIYSGSGGEQQASIMTSQISLVRDEQTFSMPLTFSTYDIYEFYIQTLDANSGAVIVKDIQFKEE